MLLDLSLKRVYGNLPRSFNLESYVERDLSHFGFEILLDNPYPILISFVKRKTCLKKIKYYQH